MKKSAIVIALGAVVIGALCYLSYSLGSIELNSPEKPKVGTMEYGKRFYSYTEKHDNITIVVIYDTVKNAEQIVLK
jgi:hypothetical protein